MTIRSKPKFRRRSDARPDEILDAALTLFVRKGFAQTKVDDIAAEAGLSKGAVYLYFPSKEALLEGLVMRAVRPVADIVVAGLADHDRDPKTVVRGVFGQLAAALADEKVIAVPLLVLREAAAVPRIAEIYRDNVLARVLPALAALLADAVARGVIRPVDPELTVRTLVGPVVMHMMLARVFGIVPDGGLGLERLLDNHLDIVFAGLEPARGAGRGEAR